LLQLVQGSKITEEDKLLAMQKLGKAASNAMVTHRATHAVNKTLVEGKEKAA
jgi:hypothetical protein